MAESDSLHSSRRDNLVDHVFIGEVLSNLRRVGVHDVEILRPEADAAGYDIAIEVGGVSRRIQQKSSAQNANTRKQIVNVALEMNINMKTATALDLTIPLTLWLAPITQLSDDAVAQQSRKTRPK